MADQIPDSAKSDVMWLNAETCIENAEIAYEDSTEDDDGPVDTVISSGDLGVLIDLARYAVATRAAPPAMDREAVELDWRLVAKLAGEHGVRYRTNRAFEQFVTAILSTLSADAIRQGEGEAATKKLMSLSRFMGEQTERENVVAWLRANGNSEAADAIELGEHEPATPASHASDGGKA